MDIVDARTLRYDEFCETYMRQNRPVCLKNIVDGWFHGVRDWRTLSNSINHAWLRDMYGHHIVPVVDGESTEYGSQSRTSMTFAEYLDLLECKEAGKLYLKDWHFVHAERSNPPVYTTPVFFEDDWLNWWWDRMETSGDDYRFVYIGPAGSWTPLHHDVFRSYSWSVNITGRKEWIFFHPDDEPKLKDKFGRTVLPDFTQGDYDRELFPLVHEAMPIYVVQETGDAIFVPSGWYHQVRNVEDTISINHNWFNGFNIGEIWSFLRREYQAVEQELNHLQDIGLTGQEFVDQCQLVMRANTGMDYIEFRDLLVAKQSDLSDRLADAGQLTAWEKDTMASHLQVLQGILNQLNVSLGDHTS